MFMYIAPSSAEPLPNLVLSIDRWKFVQIHQYYTMALISLFLVQNFNIHVTLISSVPRSLS